MRFENEKLYQSSGGFGIPHVISWICQIFVGIGGPLKEKTKNLSLVRNQSKHAFTS